MKYKLDDIDKKPQFEVPEGYFEDLPMRIQKRIEAKRPVRKVFVSWSLAIATSISLILISIFTFRANDNPVDQLLAEVPHMELVAYLDQLELEESDIAEVFTDVVQEIDLEGFGLLDELELEDQSIDEILNEYNLEEELLEI